MNVGVNIKDLRFDTGAHGANTLFDLERISDNFEP